MVVLLFWGAVVGGGLVVGGDEVVGGGVIVDPGGGVGMCKRHISQGTMK